MSAPAAAKVPTVRKQQQRKERYKQLLDDGCVIGENAESADILCTLLDVQHILEQSNLIQQDGDVKDHVDNTSEVVLDAQVMKMSHELLGSAVQSIDGVEFNDDHFVNAVLAYLNGSDPAAADDGPATATQATAGGANWSRLAGLAAPLCRSFRWSQCMLGTFDADTVPTEASQRQRQQRAPRSQATQQVKPQAMGALRPEEKPAQVLNVILKQLLQHFEQTGGEPVPYYAAVVDPHSFMHTVDNCFQVAFLFRDGHLFLDMDADGLPMIGPVQREQRDGTQFQAMRQMVSSISPALWRVSTVYTLQSGRLYRLF